MTAVDVGADVVELHLGVGLAGVGLKLAIYIIREWLEESQNLLGDVHVDHTLQPQMRDVKDGFKQLG